MINGRYTDRIEELRAVAGETDAQRNELVFRLLQILEHLEPSTADR